MVKNLLLILFSTSLFLAKAQENNQKPEGLPYTENGIQQRIQLTSKSFVFKYSRYKKNELIIKADYSWIKEVDHDKEVNFTEALDQNGINRLIAAEKYTRQIDQEDWDSPYVLIDPKFIHQITSIKGTMIVEYPTKMHSIFFNASDKGKEISHGGIAFRLKSMEKNKAEVEFDVIAPEGTDKRFTLIGLNKDNKRLEITGDGSTRAFFEMSDYIIVDGIIENLRIDIWDEMESKQLEIIAYPMK